MSEQIKCKNTMCQLAGVHMASCEAMQNAKREQRWKDPDWTCPRCQARNYGIRETCRFCGFDSALVSDGKLLEPVDDPTSVGRVLAEVRVRREEQDVKWATPEDGGKHVPSVWAGCMRKFISLANKQYPRVKADWEIYESQLIEVAALAVAAIQSSRRKRA